MYERGNDTFFTMSEYSAIQEMTELTPTSEVFDLPAECFNDPLKDMEDDSDNGLLTAENYVDDSPFPRGIGTGSELDDLDEVFARERATVQLHSVPCTLHQFLFLPGPCYCACCQAGLTVSRLGAVKLAFWMPPWSLAVITTVSPTDREILNFWA